MSLVSCPKCGKQISDKAERCVYCGFELVNKICPECSAPIWAEDKCCRLCGFPVKERDEKTESSFNIFDFIKNGGLLGKMRGFDHEKENHWYGFKEFGDDMKCIDNSLSIVLDVFGLIEKLKKI